MTARPADAAHRTVVDVPPATRIEARIEAAMSELSAAATEIGLGASEVPRPFQHREADPRDAHPHRPSGNVSSTS